MRIALGDVHGRAFWKHYLDEPEMTAFYILGDYFDSFDIPFNVQEKNFSGLCAAARADSRIKLCLGNHDYHYLRGVSPSERYSGYQDSKAPRIAKLLEDNIDLLKVMYVIDGGAQSDKWLISHAGLSVTFFEYLTELGCTAPADINDAFLRDRAILAFSGIDVYGNDPEQGPLWIRPPALVRDLYPGYNQIVGHTEYSRIREYRTEQELRVVFCDTGDRDQVYRF